MLKKVAYKIGSAAMTMLLLFSTVSFTVEKHFCGDVLIDVAVFSEVQKCTMEAFKNEQEKITKKSCCKDVLDTLEGQKQLAIKSFDDFDIKQQVFLTSYVFAFNYLIEALPKQIIPHKDYSPPNLIADRQVLDQVFLI